MMGRLLALSTKLGAISISFESKIYQLDAFPNTYILNEVREYGSCKVKAKTNVKSNTVHYYMQ